MTDGIATGWQHALWALGYLLGVLPVVLAVVLLVVAVLVVDVPHRVRVYRLRRETRRSGRRS